MRSLIEKMDTVKELLHLDRYYSGFMGRCFRSENGLLYMRNIFVWNSTFYYEFVNFGKKYISIRHGVSLQKQRVVSCNVLPEMKEISRMEYDKAKTILKTQHEQTKNGSNK